MAVVRITDFDLQKISDSGQCFRMRRLNDHEFSVMAGQRFVKITELGDFNYSLSCTAEEMHAFWVNYFDLYTDYNRFADAVDEGDEFLRRAVAYGRGIRILRQDPWEVTVSFILSQRKNIPAIRSCIEALCRSCGTPFETELGTVYAFPTPKQLAQMEICDLRGCSVGYRDKYIQQLAKSVATGAISLFDVAQMNDEDAKKALRSVYGIGEKVADCILLFGFHRLAAFPVDVWMQRVLSGAYQGAFPIQRYLDFAGVLQQYMFFYARSAGVKAG